MDVFRLFSFLLGGIVGSIGLLVGCADSDSTGQPTTNTATIPDTVQAFDVRSVTLDARHPPEPALLPRLADLGVTHVTLVAFGWQETVTEPRVRLDTTEGWYSESHRGIRSLARQADSLGMGVILKPHLWVGGYDEEQNRSEIGFETEAAWSRWEDSYRRFLLEYAGLAAEIDADVLVLGTELSRAATARPAFWRALADSARRVYDGKLTYAANWHDEYTEIDFWDALDYVGIQAYFPLTENADPSVDALRARWKHHRADLASFHRQTGTPVLFTEIGYRSARTAAEAPWRWPERDGSTEPDSTLQARCYEAFFSTMSETSWFAGAIVWKWHPASTDRDPTAFTPQDKPAERVLSRWFTSTGPVALSTRESR